MVLHYAIFFVSGFCILFTMIGYPMLIRILGKLIRKKQIWEEAEPQFPSVTVLVAAHNEEKVIGRKIGNLLELDYPKEQLEIMVTSDYSTDRTNSIVEDYIAQDQKYRIRLHVTKEHKGKINAQNEAQKTIDTEILVMTDANTMFSRDAVKELVRPFSDPKVMYVCGASLYTNTDNDTADSENTYWNMELKTREAESGIQTITSGDGAIYAVRNQHYLHIPLIESHDSSFPVQYALQNYRAVFNPKAIAYEKAGENIHDEYKRKVRMNRTIFKNILPSVKIFNVFRYRWFSFFYIGHRSLRYLLWINHLLVLISSIVLAKTNFMWSIIAGSQILFFGLGAYGLVFRPHQKAIRMVTYYSMTIFAQWKGAYDIVAGKAKPTWEKAESTR